MHEKDITQLLGPERAQPLLQVTGSFYHPAQEAHETLYRYLMKLQTIGAEEPSQRRVRQWCDAQRDMYLKRQAHGTPHTTNILHLALDELFKQG